MSRNPEPCPNCFAESATEPCPRCGWRPGLPTPAPYLLVGTLLDGRYRIGRVLGHGGFGITYLGWDDNLALKLAIKEYLPRDFATRTGDGTSVSVYTGEARHWYQHGLERFQEEARTLAKFQQHPGIVSVYNFFRANATGYMVMEYVEGITLKAYLAQQGTLPYESARKALLPVMDALRAVHAEGLLHRDVAPDNIYITHQKQVKLLDFGAARFATSGHSRSLSVILKPGYAPEEQYRSKGQQGPWTDVYGLAATLYHTLTGAVPPEALDRLEEDTLRRPSALGIGIPPAAEDMLMAGLAVRAADRPQSMEAFQQPFLLSGEAGAWSATASPLPRITGAKRLVGGAILATLLVGAVSVGIFLHGQREPMLDKEPSGHSAAAMPAEKTAPSPEPAAASATERADAMAPEDPGKISPDGKASTPDSAAARAIEPPAPGSTKEPSDPQAQYELGMKYLNGDGVAQSDAEAVKWFRMAAERGHATAQFNLGGMYANGQGVPQSDTEAVNWWRKAAEQGLAEAQFNLGVMYHMGRGVPQSDSEAASWCRKAAEQGVAMAQFNLGVSYDKGQGVPQSDSEAVKWFRKAADQGLAEAQFNLGLGYDKGLGVPQSFTEAVKWYRKAAEQGFAMAQNNLGFMYDKGRGVPQSDAEAVNWYRKAAEKGDAEAQFNLGLMYAEGRGVPQSFTEAVKWWRMAAEQGDANAQLNLGVMYHMGRGVPQSDTEAAKWYRMAADQGVANAQFNLGVMYDEGLGVPQSFTEAVKWYRKPAEQGFAKAQYNLGVMYHKGQGVPQSNAEAAKWWRKAAEGDDPEVKKRALDSLRKLRRR